MNPKPRLLLTYGPEIECFWEYTRDHAIELDDLAKDDDIMKEHLLNRSYIMHDLTDRLDYEGIRVQTEDKNFEFQPGYKDWTVMGEELFHPDPLPAGSVRIGIELVSRILNYDRRSFSEVRRVLRVMSLHVHVGSNQPYTLSWLKNFTQLVTAFEHEIETLHPDHRVREADGPVVGIAILEGCQDTEFLKDTFSAYNRYTAYNLLNIGYRDTENPKDTIEFRQHAGSLDSEEILHWVTFVGALVRYAYYTDHEELLTFCMTHLKNWENGGHYTVFDLMETIGVNFLIPYYIPKVDLRRPRQALENMPEGPYGQQRPNLQFLYDLLKDTAAEEAPAASGSDGVDRPAPGRTR